MDITDYVDEYAPETKELMEDYLPSMTIDGKIYGIPSYSNYSGKSYIFMRKDILDELGLTQEARNLSSWSGYKALLEKVRDAQSSLPENMRTIAMICNSDAQGNVMNGTTDAGADDFADDFGYETLGDSNRIIKVDADGKVVNAFASDGYRAVIERVTDWYEDGLVYKDAATAQDSSTQQMANGVTFSYVALGSTVSAEETASQSTGYDLVAVPYADMPLLTSDINAWGWGVPVHSEEPEAAVAFMNLMFTDPAIENLLVYGIEGRDYQLNDEGEAVLLDSREYQNGDFFFGNQFLAYPSEGTGSDFRERSLEALKEATLSPYFGCAVDLDPVANEQTALRNVLNKYEASLESGTAEPRTLDKMNEELENAGLQKFLDYHQEQLDAWIASNK